MNISYCNVSFYLHVSKNFISCISSLKPFIHVFKKTHQYTSEDKCKNLILEGEALAR